MGYLDVLLDFFKENNFQQFIKITYTEWILLTKSCCVQSSLSFTKLVILEGVVHWLIRFRTHAVVR